jgi:predicted enzyme involved in methoxymalonyl-ACP biosynthesis
MIAVIIGKVKDEEQVLDLDTWLMSCRVLGRQAEEATLNLIVQQARALNLKQLIGSYLPSAKNGMVKEHYGRLGFALAGEAGNGNTVWTLDLDSFQPKPTFIQLVEAANDQRTDFHAANRDFSRSLR